MNELKVFDGNNVEIIEDEKGNILFEIYSTGMALGQVKINSIGKKYPRTERIDDNLKSAEIKPCVHNGHSYITEEQLYDLMLEMKTDKVKPFRKWVTSEILPSIRKNGGYISGQEELKPEELIAKALVVANNIIENQKKELEEKTKTLNILTHVKKLYSTTEIAKEIGLKSAFALNKTLIDKKIQYKQNGTYVLYSKYSDLGYESIKQEVLDNGKVIYHRKWTQRGREFILNLLKGE